MISEETYAYSQIWELRKFRQDLYCVIALEDKTICKENHFHSMDHKNISWRSGHSCHFLAANSYEIKSLLPSPQMIFKVRHLVVVLLLLPTQVPSPRGGPKAVNLKLSCISALDRAIF